MRDPDSISSLLVLCSKREDVLVGDGDLLFESIQLWIVIHLPPLSRNMAIARLRQFPAFRQRFFKRARDRRGRVVGIPPRPQPVFDKKIRLAPNPQGEIILLLIFHPWAVAAAVR